MISGNSPPSRPKITSTMCRESRTVPDTTLAPRPIPRSLMALSHVMPLLDPKYFLLGRANAAGTGTTNRIPSDRGDHAAPRLGEGKPGLAGDQRGVRGGQGLGPDVVLEDVRQPGALQRRYAFLGDGPVPD